MGFSAGMTREAYTDNRGDAFVEHTSVGQAEIYVSGAKYHAFRAPGHSAVTLR